MQNLNTLRLRCVSRPGSLATGQLFHILNLALGGTSYYSNHWLAVFGSQIVFVAVKSRENSWNEINHAHWADVCCLANLNARGG